MTLRGRWLDKFYKQPLYMPQDETLPEPVQPEVYDPLPEQQELTDMPRDQSPLAILNEIRDSPSPKGAYPTIIGGRPVDFHILEDYLLKVSPYALKTILRYNHARAIEEIKNYARMGAGVKMNSKLIIMILIAVGMCALGVIAIFFLPQIMGAFSGSMGLPAVGGQ